MATNLPGSKILSGMGGYTNVIDPNTGQFTRLDVAYWEVDRDIRLFHKAHSGSLGGAILSRVTGYDWTVNLRIWWDRSNPPEDLLIQGFGCGLQLSLGSFAGQQSYGYVNQQFYLAPSGLLKRFHVRDSSEGENNDIIIADATVVSNALLFLMPDESAAYASWAAQSTALGQFTPLAQLTTMQ